MTRTRTYAALAISTCCSAVLGAELEDLPTIDGPEATTLVQELKGFLVSPNPPGGIIALDLPSLEKRSIRPPGKHPGIHELSGPDRKGRIALVEGGASREVVLWLVRLDGAKGEELTRRPDLGSQSRALGRPVLSPAGEHVAIVVKTETLRLRVEPKTSFREGQLEVWQTVKPQMLPGLEVKALDRSLAWIPDGKSLLYSALVGPEIFHDLIEAYGEATGTSTGLIPAVERRVAVVHRLDLKEKKATPLCIGRRSVVSTDGETALVQGIGFEWMVLDLASGRLRPVKLPGLYDRDRLGIYEGGVVALIGGDLAIYWALPTTGAIQRETKSNSPLVGAKKMPSIKVTRLSTGEFQTLIPHQDSRREVQFGERSGGG